MNRRASTKAIKFPMSEEALRLTVQQMAQRDLSAAIASATPGFAEFLQTPLAKAVWNMAYSAGAAGGAEIYAKVIDGARAETN